LDAAGAVTGCVTASVFGGDRTELTVEVTGASLHVRVTGRDAPPVGARVRLAVDPAAVLVYPAGRPHRAGVPDGPLGKGSGRCERARETRPRAARRAEVVRRARPPQGPAPAHPLRRARAHDLLSAARGPRRRGHPRTVRRPVRRPADTRFRPRAVDG